MMALAFDLGFHDGSVSLVVPWWVAALFVLAVCVIVFFLWGAKHKQDPKVDLWRDDDFRPDARTLAGVTHGSVADGNSIELLENGEFFERLFEEIGRATRSIHFETFLWKTGRVAERLVELLTQKSRQGVLVRVLLDGTGGKIEKEERKRLIDAGCKVHSYHAPRALRGLGRINNRDHRKIVVFDGRIGMVGGHCITDDWLGNASSRKEFRDLSVIVQGPVVHQIQSAFLDNWIEESGEVASGDAVFPELEPAGDCRTHLAWVSPTGRTSSLKILHDAAVCAAKKTLRIQNPYFLPDPEAIELMCRAVRRGVDIRVMIPSAHATDSPIVQHASHHRYGALLEGGIRIFEYQRTLLHQKVLTVDGVWSAIGSTNFDDRSFELNDEVTLGVESPGFAKQMEEIFERDLEHCIEVTRETHRKRTILHRLTDLGAFVVNEQL
jgi:cardiolipin synthase A/B